MWRDPYAYNVDFAGANALPGGAPGAAKSLPLTIDREGDFAIYETRHIATSTNYVVGVVDQDSRQIITGGAGQSAQAFAHSGAMYGTGQSPNVWPAARIVKRTNVLTVTAQDQSGAANTVRHLYVGAQLFTSPPFVIPNFQFAEAWWLTIGFGPLPTDNAPAVPATTQSQFGVNLPGDSWVEVHTLMIAATNASPGGGASLQILTNGAREWFRNPIHIALLGAQDLVQNFQGVSGPIQPSAGFPHRFNPPKLLPIRTTLLFSVTDLSGAANTVRIVLGGVRRYAP